MKKFRQLVRESRVEDKGLPSEAALSLKDRRNKEAMPKLREQNDTTEKEEMAETQLHFIKYAAEEILEFIDMDGEIEEWYQNKLSKVHSDMEGLHSYIEGEKRRTGMVKEASAEELLAVAKKVSPNAKISTPETRKKDKEDYEKRTAKYAGKPNTPSAYLNRPQSYPLGGYDPKSNRSYSEEYESVPASKALQKAHEDERKRRGLPDPDYYLKLRDQKKKEIEDMKKEEVKLDEISPGLAARAASGASDPDYEGRASHENIARMATKKFGAKIGGQISNTDKGHWPKEYGSKKQLAPSGIDKLSWRKPTRTTASGKANKQDISALKNRMKEEVESLEEKNVPTSPEKWAQAKAQAKAKFDVYPSAYANGWAAKKYKAMGGGWKSVSEESELEEGYYKNQEIERQETERLKPPFTPDKPKKQVVAGKKPEGYSTARHLARQAMQKYKKPVKESLEESRRAEIVKEIIKKKKNEDKFNAEPIISDTVTRNT